MRSIFTLAFLFSIPVYATISNFSASGYSYKKIDGTSTYIFGGLSGDCTGAADSTCNSCTSGSVAGTLASCNPVRVHSGLNLSLTFTSTSSGKACIMTTGTSPSQIGTTATYTAGSSITLTVPWGTLCDQIDSSTANCTTDYESHDQATFEVGVDTAGNCASLTDKQQFFVVISGLPDLASAAEPSSIADFEAYPGDEKIYLKNIESFLGADVAYTPERGESDINALIAFYLPNATCADQPTIVNTTAHQGASVETTGEITDNRIRGLVNDTPYVFRLAAQDESMNIGMFTNSVCTAEVHTATPDDVYGLLENEKNCFIATAAFGSILDPHVQTFRDFRDQFLTTSVLGKKFVQFYYKNSPRLADYISQHEYLRLGTQAALIPVWGLAWLYLNMGPISANLIVIVLIGGIIFALNSRKKVTP